MQKPIEIIKRALLNPIQLPFFLTFNILMILFSGLGSAETHPIWNPTEYVNLCNKGDRTNNISELQNKVSNLLSMSKTDLRNQLNNNGKANIGSTVLCGGSNLGSNINTVDKVYILALLYHFTNNSDYAWRAAVLLDRYAEVFPNWPKNYSYSKGGGIWSNWMHTDLQVAHRLALAYDLIQNSGQLSTIGSSDSEIETFLTNIIQEDFKFRFYTHNTSYWRPMGVVIFGRVLNDPELAHVGYWYFKKYLYEGYGYNGFWHEGTYSYQWTASWTFTESPYRELQAFYLDGYSDPPNLNYTPFDRLDPPRYDNYSVENQFGAHLDRIYNVTENTLMPDGHYPICNETSRYKSAAGNPASGSFLLGGTGHAVLAYGSGSAQTQARLDFSPSLSHAHNDALNLIYYDKQEEVVGGTGYYEGNQSWNQSTLNQNLVVVNGQQQKYAFWTDFLSPPYIPGGGGTGSAMRRPLFSGNNVHNNLNLFETGDDAFDKVQVTEADGINAYEGTATRYLRMLALVNVSGSDMYLVDFFRVKGGTQYDWSIHGNPDAYSTSTSLSMGSASGSFGSISFTNSSTTANSWSGTFAYSGSGTKEKFTLCGESGTTVYKGSGPRSGSGSQGYIVARRTASTDEDINFMATHEVYKSSPHIQAVEKLEFDGSDGTAVGMKVTLENGVTDYIIHTLDEGPSYPEHRVTGVNNFAIKGRFAHVRVTNGTISWMKLLQGSDLSYGSKTLSSNNGDYSHRGMVTKVNRKAEGASENSFEVDTSLPSNGVLDGKTLILTWGNGWKWGYKIKSASGNRILTDDEPAFNYSGNEIDMQFFPVPEYLGLKSFPGPVSFLIPGTATMDEFSNIVDTDGVLNQPVPLTAPDNLRFVPTN